MKKLLSLLALQFIFIFAAYAQGRGNVFIVNNTNCDFCVEVYAACQDGSHYTTDISYCAAPGVTKQIYFAGGPFSVGSWLTGRPWVPGIPMCEWEWQYAHFNIPTANYITPAGPMPLENYIGYTATTFPFPHGVADNNYKPWGTLVAEDVISTCSNTLSRIYFKWERNASGDIIITAHY